MSKPTVLLVPGLWEGPSVFTTVIASLNTLSYPTQVVSLPSTGYSSPGNPSMRDDESAIRSVLQKLIVEEEKIVVMVMHSAGGFLGSAATKGLDRKKREEEGKKGGLFRLVFLCAGVAEIGHFHADLPFMDLETRKESGEMICVRPRELLFNDLSSDETDKWMSVLRPQPLSGWGMITEYAGWKEIPSVYLICETDQVLPASLQEQMATMIGARIERCGSGHMVMLSMPERVVEIIKSVVGEI